MKYRIKNGFLLLFDGKDFYVKKEDLFINEDKIEAIGEKNIDNTEAYTEINAENQLIMPGLINSHTHVYMNFMKNSADDLPFNTWLFDKIFPVEILCKNFLFLGEKFPLQFQGFSGFSP